MPRWRKTKIAEGETVNVAAVKQSIKPGKLFIDGKWEDSMSGKVVSVMNPATGEQVTTVPEAGAEEVDRAVRDAQEATEIANGTIYGLTSAVWTRDIGVAHSLAREIKVGSVRINAYNCFDSNSPFGGYKQSGFGRDMGPRAIESHPRVKSVWVSLD